MISSIRSPIFVFAVASLCVAGAAEMAGAQGEEQHALRPSPEAFYNQAVRSATPGKDGAGEQFCWRANFNMGIFLQAYEAWHDTAWLDWGVKFYDYAISKMGTGPDGRKGWIGAYIYDGQYACDVHVGDAVLVDHMLEFAEVVLKDPKLKAKYGEAATRYVELARNDVIDKWDARGTWREDGPYGSYVMWDHYCKPGDPTDWQKLPDVKNSGLSLPFNKQNDMALVCLKLYRITGEKSYRDKAEKIFAFMRSRFQYVDDYYVWNYWEPFGPWDIDVPAKESRHWMNVHGYRNYQAGEIGQIVEAYHTGVVFTETDMRRIISTNLEVMWNKDKAAPKFVNSNAALPVPEMTEEQRKAQEAAIAANPYAKEGRAGCLWTGLLDFDQTVRDLYALQLAGDARDTRGKVARDYFKNVTCKSPPSFARKYAKDDVTVPQVPVTQCRSLTVATVMPCTMKRGTSSLVFCKARIPVDVEIALYSADGKQLVSPIYKGKIEGGTDGHAGVFFVQWDPQSVEGQTLKGPYRVRWTVADGYREFPVMVGD
ncbi:MAG: hypothetical protein JXL80_15210 [Planctomycetes bacterium]|nr:hypothetical protein [Planctomycetota bacterium]